MPRLFRRLVKILGPVIRVALFAAAGAFLYHELKAYHYHDIMAEAHRIPLRSLGLAGLLTVLNFCLLCVYEILGFRYIRNGLSWPRIALTAVLSYSISNNVGFYSISSSAVRLRMYSQWGLSTVDITRLILFSSGLAFWMGLCAVLGGVFLFEPMALPSALHLPFTVPPHVGGLFLLPVALFFLLTLIRRKPFRFRDWEFEVPSPGLTGLLILTACGDWLLFASVLYALLPLQGMPFPAFLGVFFLAQLLGLASHVPGGLGVFESVMVLLLPAIPASRLLGVLLVFRVVYYLIPLCVSALFLAINEFRSRRLAPVAARIGRLSNAAAPPVFALLTFLAGAVLLASGATPGITARLAVLMRFCPFPFLELSHFLGSITGIILMLLAWGLYRRLDSAYHLTLYGLALGILFSLFKGLDWEEALILSVLFLSLLPARRYFYRKSHLLQEPLTPGWAAAAAVILLTVFMLGMFSYRHVDYAHELWWQFSLDGHASRFLRAQAGVLILALAFAFRKLTSTARHPAALCDPHETGEVESLVRASSRSSAWLAVLGDKRFFFSPGRDAFLMYGLKGRSAVVMGDPVGAPASFGSLVWEFRADCDRYSVMPVFYEVGREWLPLYLDVGMTLLKIGEEARVSLPGFSLDGGAKKGLRYNLQKVEREGWEYAVIPPEKVTALLPDLKSVSDEWLALKRTREKGFSLGFFSEPYIARTPVAVLRRAGKISAFANLWVTDAREEASIDLMRYSPDAPRGAMDFLLCRLLLWAKGEGYRWFNLGMSPFSGIESRLSAPLWNRLGSYLFRYGESFYHFQGLRQYKDKFDPVWEPRYLASQGGLSLPFVLKDLAVTVSGGVKGIFSK